MKISLGIGVVRPAPVIFIHNGCEFRRNPATNSDLMPAAVPI